MNLDDVNEDIFVLFLFFFSEVSSSFIHLSLPLLTVFILPALSWLDTTENYQNEILDVLPDVMDYHKYCFVQRIVHKK